MAGQKQISALKYFIYKSKDCPDLTKRVVWYLIDQSAQLTEEVCLTLYADCLVWQRDEVEQAARGMHDLQSSNGTTHLHALLSLMGCDLDFSYHYGDYDPTRSDDPFSSAGQFAGWDRSKVQDDDVIREGMPLRYTFWLARDSYSRTAKLVFPKRVELETIDLASPGLYPSIEPFR